MSTSKKFSDNLSSVVFMWIAFGLGLIAVLMMFVPAIFGTEVRTSADIFWNSPDGTQVGAWPVFMGYMFILVAALLAGFVALPFFQPSRGAEMKLLGIATVLFLAGSVITFLTTIIFAGMNGGSLFMFTQYAGPYIAGGLSLLCALGTAFAMKLDW